jgi:SAM-dependent methyltransferase
VSKIEPFEKNARQYDEWFERNHFAYDSELDAIRMLLPKVGNGTEIGVGTGRFAAPLGIKLGIEPSEAMGMIARQRGIEVVNGVAESLPFSDSVFDFALMVTTICFVENVELALKEARRVLRPRGHVIIGLIDRESPLGVFYQKHRGESVFYGPAVFYSVDDVVSILKEAGFGDFSFVQTIFHNLTDLRAVEPVKDGYGEGSFVVIKAARQL